MIIPLIIPIQSYPRYIKKVELEAYLQKQAKGVKLGFIIGVIAGMFVQIILGVLVMPKLYELYNTLNQTPPPYLSLLLLISLVLGMVVIAIIATSNPLDPNKVKGIKQDKEELVTINNSLVNKKLLWLFFGYLAIVFAVIAFGIILPIMGLTASVETRPHFKTS